MRFAAPFFAEKLKKLSGEYVSILCSTYVDVATLKALSPLWIHDVPIITYFHENQFAYPMQVNDERDVHFALTNLTTAWTSDRIVFNSQYNLASFLDGCRELIQKSPDMSFNNSIESIRRKAIVIYPAIDFSGIDQAPSPKRDNPLPIIVWNHRWEHDKNPELFFQTLFDLDGKGLDFNIVVLGQSFERKPRIFEKAKKILAHRIIQFGYVESKEEYHKWLKMGDVIVSTATHEFFGIAVLEAVRAGCRPLLPNRLSYPELFPKAFLYDDETFIERFIETLNQGRLSILESKALTQHYSLESLSQEYFKLLTETTKDQ